MRSRYSRCGFLFRKTDLSLAKLEVTFNCLNINENWIFEARTLSEEAKPKVFISYRWTSPDHEDWVLAFASRLREDGLDVILDKWHLKGGQDTLTFMEKMVADNAVKKVLMICDKGYVDRANSRAGGVGTEAQIISGKVYEATDQTKFGAVVVELDAEGKPYLPHYFRTRLYFDLSTNEALAVNYEEVVRWCYDKPFHVAPPVGKRPSFLEETKETASLSVPSTSRRLVGRSDGRVDRDELSQLAAEVAKIDIELDSEAPDDSIVAAIDGSREFREACYSAIRRVLRSEVNDARKIDLVHGFLEKAFSNAKPRPSGPISAFHGDFKDFIAHDLLVSTVAIAFSERSFGVIDKVLKRPFIRRRYEEQLGEAFEFRTMRPYLKSLDEFRKRRLNLNRISVHADKLRECHEGSTVDFVSFMEADFSIYVRDKILPDSKKDGRDWYPTSLVFAVRRDGAFPLFLRAMSADFWEEFSTFFDGLTADEMRSRIRERFMHPNASLHWDYDRLDVAELANLEKLGTR